MGRSRQDWENMNSFAPARSRLVIPALVVLFACPCGLFAAPKEPEIKLTAVSDKARPEIEKAVRSTLR